MDEGRTVAPACGRDVAWTFRVDGARKRRLFLGAVHRVVGGAVEDDLRSSILDHGFDCIRIDDRKPVVRNTAVGAEQLDEL